jgi:hypothetical protein
MIEMSDSESTQTPAKHGNQGGQSGQ